jgi:hypothetical protein
MGSALALRAKGARRNRHDEQDLVHRPVIDHLRARAYADSFWWHTPAGEKRDRLSAAILVGLGAKAGIPDLLVLRRSRLHGLEFKFGSGALSPAQRETFPRLQAAGCEIGVAYSVDEALRWLEDRNLIRGRTAC